MPNVRVTVSDVDKLIEGCRLIACFPQGQRFPGMVTIAAIKRDDDIAFNFLPDCADVAHRCFIHKETMAGGWFEFE